MSTVYLTYNSSDINATRYTYVSFKYERQIDGEWNDYPSSLNSSMMKAAKIKDINQPVNEGNLDKSKSYTYSTGDTYLCIRRPLVLTPTEKANVAKNDTINGLLKYEWDGNEFYSGLYFGDGAGSIMITDRPYICRIRFIFRKYIRRRVSRKELSFWKSNRE